MRRRMAPDELGQHRQLAAGMAAALGATLAAAPLRHTTSIRPAAAERVALAVAALARLRRSGR